MCKGCLTAKTWLSGLGIENYIRTDMCLCVNNVNLKINSRRVQGPAGYKVVIWFLNKCFLGGKKKEKKSTKIKVGCSNLLCFA